MLKELTKDCFKVIISLVESGKPEDIFGVISSVSAEDCARLYVASLLLQYRPFPEKIRVSRYSTVLNDSGAFFELYKVAACHGIGISEIEALYNSSELPEMIWTESDENPNLVYPDPEPEPVKDNLVNPLLIAFKDLKINPAVTKLKRGACPCSTQMKKCRKSGAKVTSYKVVFNGHSIIINIADDKGGVSYDINTYFCKDLATFENEFKRKFIK